jgi:hypothetical protein
MRRVILAHHFLARLRLRLERRGTHQRPSEEPTPVPVDCLGGTPPASLPQALQALALALVAYIQRHNLAAYRSHRQRALQRLAAQGP